MYTLKYIYSYIPRYVCISLYMYIYIPITSAWSSIVLTTVKLPSCGQNRDLYITQYEIVYIFVYIYVYLHKYVCMYLYVHMYKHLYVYAR
jgi:cytochrome P450 family 4